MLAAALFVIATTAAAPAQQPARKARTADPALSYSPWTKSCEQKESKQVCYINKDARIGAGAPVVSAVLIETEGEPKKLLRIALPLGTSLIPGTRIIVDQEAPISAPFSVCIAGGCIADYEVDAEMVAKMKKGQTLTIQKIDLPEQLPVNLPLPLGDFQKAYDGPATSRKVKK
jgi:invasion protein IalB